MDGLETFEIEEIETVEAPESVYWWLGLEAAVVVGIAAC